MKQLKSIPQFRNEDEEREFWAINDSTEYIDWSKSKKTKFSNLKPSTETISIRLPISLLESIKILANKKDVPYQSLIKILLSDKVIEETKSLNK